MSISNLNITLQKELLKKLIDNVSADLKIAQGLSKVNKFDFKTSTTTSMIRDITDRKQIGVLSRATIGFLASEYTKINLDTLRLSGRVFDKNGVLSKSAGLKTLKAAIGNLEDPKEVNILVKSLGTQVSSVLSKKAFWESFSKKLPEDSVEIYDDEVIQLKPAYHGTFLKLFIQYVSSEAATASISKELIADFLSSTLDTGHLLGIFNQRLTRSIGSGEVKYNSDIVGDIAATIFDKKYASEQELVDKANSVYTAALGTLEQLDYLSSQLVFSPDIFIRLSKEVYGSDNPSAAAEFQLSFLNSAAGREIAAAGAKLSDIMNKAVDDIRNKKRAAVTYDSDNSVRPKSIDFANALEEVFSKIAVAGSSISSTVQALILKAETAEQKRYLSSIEKLSKQFAQTLLESKGSDSILESIGKSTALVAEGKPLPKKQASSTSKNTKAKKPTAKPNISKRVKLTNPAKRKVVLSPIQGSRVSIGGAPRIDLLSLQRLINASLVERVKQNMGRGDRRDILNLRTGRFAESVKVERLSESRQGMITAFYTYMKNPYATFSEGGRQQNPRSRDPKLLISKSIREIAAQEVANRMRAVLV